jgi:PAS domain S-box-containing protein/putative nucleotidyltransferase with HDIG domain
MLRSRTAISVGLFGWLIFISYILYDYFHYKSMTPEHFLRPDVPYEYYFHLVILSSLIGSQITAYLINQRKRLLQRTMLSEKRLNDTLKEWRTILDSMPYGVMLIDKEFNIIRANRYISEISGIPVDELTSKKCYQVLHRIDSSIDECPLKRSLMTGTDERIEMFDKDRGKYFISSVTPISDENNEITAFAHPLIDITELKLKEQDLRRSRDAFLNILKDVNRAHKELQDIYYELLLAFSTAIDAKSPWTRGHSERVTRYATMIAREMGVDGNDLDNLRIAGLLHDIGKIGTYDVILDKPSNLTDDELSIVKMHPVNGEKILRPIKGLKRILPIVRSHHERWDGKGYPDGLKGEDIPLLARILFVADSYDSMTSDRPYRPSPGREYAISELKRCAGTQFDPDIVEAFLRVIERDKKDEREAADRRLGKGLQFN